jgi:hypothetical protein
MSEGAPICRWEYKSVKVDIMPINKAILGFGNEWYVYGMKRKVQVTLPGGRNIHILSSPVYLCSKLQAVLDRGISDLRLSHDFEDVIYVIDNCGTLEEDLISADEKVKAFLKKVFMRFKKISIFNEAVECALPLTAGDRADELISKINQFFIGE